MRHVLAARTTRPVRLVLFASGSQQSADDLAALYARRWDVETDIRTLKHSLSLARLRSRLPEVLAKELVLGFCAYNLVRAFGALAADRAGIPPRRVSFVRMAACLQGYAPRLAAAESSEQRRALLEEMLERAAARTLKPRDREHPPRTSWHRDRKFPPKKVPSQREKN